MLIGDLRIGMLSKALVDGAVDLLAHMAAQTPPALATRGGEFLDPLLFEALTQLRFASPLLPIALLPLSQFAVECPVVLAVACRDEVSNPHVYADRRGRGFCVYWNHLIVAQGQPPCTITALVEGHAGIDGLALEHLAVVGSQLDGDQQLPAECERADLEPVVEGGVLGGFKHSHVGVGLDAGLPEHRDIPLAPRWFFGVRI